MAGISFELKRVFEKSDTIASGLRAIIMSTLITIGPWIITVLLVNVLLRTAINDFASKEEYNLFLGTIIYGFIFSQILVYPWQLLVTRFVSDKLYNGDESHMLASLSGTMKVVIFITTLINTVFFFTSPLPSGYKLLVVNFFVILSLIWLLMVYVVLVKNYRLVFYTYGGGILGISLLYMIFQRFPIPFKVLPTASNLLSAFLIGLIFIFTLLIRYLFSIFEEIEIGEFEFLKYFKNYWKIFAIGSFYMLGTWSHVILRWFMKGSEKVADTYYFFPAYDSNTFYAFLITAPSIVVFIVFTETTLFTKIREYFTLIRNGENLRKLNRSAQKIEETLFLKVSNLMKVQLFITLIFLLYGKHIFGYLGVDVTNYEYFIFVSLGAIGNVFIFIIISILFYFDELDKNLKITVVFFISNLIGVLACTNLTRLYGFDYFIASTLSLIYAFSQFEITLDRFTQKIFTSQNYSDKPVGAKLNLVVKVLNKFVKY